MVKIKEVIVVEGRDDERALKAAVDAEIIITRGFGINDKIYKKIEAAQKRCGVIIFTDPDFAGERIRESIEKRVPGCKHCFLSAEEATDFSDGDIGIENATPESIIKALEKVKTVIEREPIFTKSDLVAFGLIGGSESKQIRAELGRVLGIGYCNGKRFLKRLNNYGISKEEFINGLKIIDRMID